MRNASEKHNLCNEQNWQDGWIEDKYLNSNLFSPFRYLEMKKNLYLQ